MKKHSFFALPVLYLFTATVSAQDYESNSVFKDDYRCVATEVGGYNHTAEGHEPSRFWPDDEFFLVHISNVPEQVLIRMLSKPAKELLESITEQGSDKRKTLARSQFEKQIMKQKVWDDMTVEEGSYFIREPSSDPKKPSTYFIGNNCESWKTASEALISCYVSDNGKTFQFDPVTGRFTYSYAGSWHEEVSDGYYGDSSSFAFGTCQKYYR